MVTPLIAKKIEGNTAIIMNNTVDYSNIIPAEVIWKK